MMTTELVRSYQDLAAWQRAMELKRKINRISRDFPKDEIFGLVSQIRRAAVSISSKFAEGHKKYLERNISLFLVRPGPDWQGLRGKS
jgi:beta-galactosidase beta subunit